MSYLLRNREKILPEVQGDFTSEHDEIKNKSVREMTMNEWIWFSRDHYVLQYYGAIICSILLFAGASWWLSTLESHVRLLMYVFMFLAVFMGFELYRRIQNWNVAKQTTLYDLYFKEVVLSNPNKEGESEKRN